MEHRRVVPAAAPARRSTCCASAGTTRFTAPVPPSVAARQGKLTARERIERLLDPGSFTELDMFAMHRTTNFGMEDRRIRGDGVVTGWGTIEGRQVFVFSHDASVFGGSLGEVFAEKVTKVMDLALRTGFPASASTTRAERASRRGSSRWPDTPRSSIATSSRAG